LWLATDLLVLDGMKCTLLVVALAACGTDHAQPTQDQPDAGNAAPDASGYVDLAPPAQGFQIKTPDIQIMPGQEITYCYYFHTPNTTPTVVKSWQSRMTPGSHHMILYLSGTADQPDGTLDPTGGCGVGASGNLSDLPVWTYLAQTPDNTNEMPSDDGNGLPVGMLIPVGQPAVMQMHYLNSSDDMITVHVTLNGNAYDPNTQYTPAAAFVTYNTKIDIPAGVGMTASASGQCAVPSTQKFFTMTTHSHKQSVETMVTDGSSMILDSLDWEHATVDSWNAPFYTFASGKLGYQCNYVNQGNAEIKAGPSAQTNEMCMAVGYNFPATKATFCVNSLVVPQN
jgi:hypothetical protein